MRYPVRFLVRRWWWAKWHPAVRVGWIVTRNNGSGSQTQTIIGLGLIAAGLVLRSKRRQHLYTTKVDTARSVAITNVPPHGSLTGG